MFSHFDLTIVCYTHVKEWRPLINLRFWVDKEVLRCACSYELDYQVHMNKEMGGSVLTCRQDEPACICTYACIYFMYAYIRVYKRICRCMRKLSLCKDKPECFQVRFRNIHIHFMCYVIGGFFNLSVHLYPKRSERRPPQKIMVCIFKTLVICLVRNI